MEEVLIIGGGFAGLAAGVALAKAGRRVRLLEQKPHLGGRARSFVDPQSGFLVDNGQHIIMGCYHAALRFLGEIGTLERIALQCRLRVHFLEPPGRLTTLECPNLPSPWHMLAGVLRSDSFGWREKREVLRLGRALASEEKSRDSLSALTVEEWLVRLGQSEKVRRGFWDLLAIAALNEDPRRAAAAVFARVLRLALFSSPADSRLGIPRFGLSDCYTGAAQAYITSRGGQVELNRSVAGFLIAEGVCRGVRLADGSEIEAASVVSAVPWHELARLLPGELLRSEPTFTNLLALRPAPIISINLWYDRAITELDFAALRGTTVQWLFNRSRIPSAGENCISLVLSGAHALTSRSKEELLTVALGDLGELLPAAREAKLLHSLVIKERFATFSPCVGVDELRPPARSPVRGLYLAGDWTATRLPATIEGAVASGYAAAQALLKRD
ncbi:MAG: hydroxysqualene dehydroxylase HpnE [Acidobacteriia bacterium]|nr:hydroxysqualene dehydroxylase HpnE [Terriglobia bacterium]